MTHVPLGILNRLVGGAGDVQVQGIGPAGGVRRRGLGFRRHGLGFGGQGQGRGAQKGINAM